MLAALELIEPDVGLQPLDIGAALPGIGGDGVCDGRVDPVFLQRWGMLAVFGSIIEPADASPNNFLSTFP